MKLSTLLTTQILALSSASPTPESPHPWIPAGPDDVRGPCPMMNTLANHAYLPHSGLNITKPNAIAALTAALNFNASLASLMWDQAIIANPEPNATFFTLEHLNVHNVLEHDASLSRTDAYFGNNHIFNATIFEQSRRYWTADVITADMLANSKVARQIESKAFNPNYTFTSSVESFSLGEVAAPFIAFGDIEKITVNKALVEYFFENERLPEELGWTRRESVVNVQDVMGVSKAIGKATSLLTDSGDAAPHKAKRGDFHAGVAF